MRGIRVATALTPAVAVVSVMTTLVCCLPWGIGAALGMLGLSVFLARFQPAIIVLSILLLGVGLIQILHLRRRCRRRSHAEIAIWAVAATVVLVTVLFPQLIACLLASYRP
jgi:hypothetical protein